MKTDNTENKKNMTKAKKIYNVVSTVVVALIFVFLVTLVSLMLVQKKNGGETEIFGHYLFDVVTDSMSGTIEKGEVIVAKKVNDVYALKVGDIITFTAPSGVLKGYNETHRIVEILYDENGKVKGYKTAGDKLYNGSVKVDDWQLPPENVKAIFVRKSAFIGGLKSFLSHWYGYVVIVVVPMCLVFALVIAGFVRDRLALEKEKEPKTTLADLSEEEKKKLLSLVEDDKKPQEDIHCDCEQADGEKPSNANESDVQKPNDTNDNGSQKQSDTDKTN